MKKANGILVVALLILSLAGLGAAAASSQPMPRTLANSRFYVTAYDGDQFDPNLLPEDRAAIGRVQDAIQKWGKLIIVYRPQEADVILAVQSRASEDVLAVYEAHSGDWRSGPSSSYLWRVMARGGLQKGEAPLVSQFEKAWDGILRPR